MRSKLSLFLAVLLAATVASVGLGTSNVGAISVADLQSAVVGDPLEVSPVGGIVLYEVTFTNNGPAPVLAQLTDKTDGGTFESGLSNIGDCTVEQTSSPVINCDRVLAAGMSLQIEVAVRTPSSTTTLKNTATALVDPSVATTVVDETPGNNEASVPTPVSNNPNSSSAVVKKGETLTFRTHKVTVTEGANGILIRLNEALPIGDSCGTSICGAGLHLEFGADPDRQGTMRVELNFSSDPCRGKGTDKCIGLYERKYDEVTGAPMTPTAVPMCSDTTDPDKTCLISASTKVGTTFQHTVRMVSTDPDLIPPGVGLS